VYVARAQKKRARYKEIATNCTVSCTAFCFRLGFAEFSVFI
jgi:hypothetical protein